MGHFFILESADIIPAHFSYSAQRPRFLKRRRLMDPLEASRLVTDEYSAKILVATFKRPRAAIDLSRGAGNPTAPRALGGGWSAVPADEPTTTPYLYPPPPNPQAGRVPLDLPHLFPAHPS